MALFENGLPQIGLEQIKTAIWYIWANKLIYNNSLTWNVGLSWGWFPLLTMIILIYVMRIPIFVP